MPISMRYDVMRQRYPQIEELFKETAQLVHGAAGPDLAHGWALTWIGRNIFFSDRAAVIEKVEKWIDAIKE